MGPREAYPPEELIPVLKSCLDLNQAYQKQYEITKDRLMNMPKGKQFEFSPNQIFGKFDLFCRRVSKLIELFGTIHQFRTLERHNLEGIGDILQSFYRLLRDCVSRRRTISCWTTTTTSSTATTWSSTWTCPRWRQSCSSTSTRTLRTSPASKTHSDCSRSSKLYYRETICATVSNSKYTILFHNYGLVIH